MIRSDLRDVSRRNGVMNIRDKRIRSVVTGSVVVFSWDMTSIIKVRVRRVAVLRSDPTGSGRTERGTKRRVRQAAIDCFHRNACWENGKRREETKTARAESESERSEEPWEVRVENK